MRSTSSVVCRAMLLAAMLLVTAEVPAVAQPSEIDWGSTLILRFDPAALLADPADPAPDPAEPLPDPAISSPGPTHETSYLSEIAGGLKSGWITQSGSRVIAVGPLFGPVIGTAVSKMQPVIDASLGTEEDWVRLLSEAKQANVVVALHVTLPESSEECETLAQWARTSGVRHLIVEGSGGCDVSALRAALDARGEGANWIAKGRGSVRRGAGDVVSGVSIAGGGANDFVDGEADDLGARAADDLGVRAAEAADRQTEPDRQSIDAAPSADSPFDAVLESISADALGDEDGLGEFYRRLAQRAAEARQSLILDVVVSPESIHLATRALILPGAVQITAPMPLSDAADLWRTIAAFRARHPAVGRGEHVDLVNNAFAFARMSTDRGLDDRVVVVLGASGSTTVNVSRIFPDNAMLQDALTGRTAFVSFGMAAFEAGPSGMILIEEAF